ncbi:MAG: hypothetical protein DMF04_07280 [Verrucomicrobia bacterium]|nr:MAG: hypothetical protein DMF04_07280 [Verrucomicrobiota bacterium]
MSAEAYAPGRVELLGNHTDYNEGVVLGAAIDRGLNVTGERREDGLIVVHSALLGNHIDYNEGVVLGARSTEDLRSWGSVAKTD